MLVHLFGQMCDMNKILKIAKKYKLKVVLYETPRNFVKYSGK